MIKFSNKTAILGNLDGRGADASVRVGGKSEIFTPNLNASKWNDEVFLNVNPMWFSVKKSTVFKEESGIFSLTNNDIRYQTYLKNGKLEKEFVFTKKPILKQIEYELLFTEGLQFYRQPSLYEEWEKSPDYPGQTWEHFQETTTRFENAVGSYAVYWTKRNNKYRTGKFCHIYRPKLIDAIGAWIWAEMRIESGKLIIDLPKEWMQKAVYPVTLDPTFGYETQGTSGTKDLRWQRGSPYLNDQGAGNVTTISAYLTSFGGGEKVELAIYDPDNGDAKVGISQEITNGDDGWNDFSPDGSFAVVNNNNYLLVAWSDSIVLIHYDSGAATSLVGTDVGYGTWPDTLAVNKTVDEPYHSIHVDFTAAGGAAPTGVFYGPFVGPFGGPI